MKKKTEMMTIPVAAAHDLYHHLERFKYVKNCPCMDRDKSECHRRADQIQKCMEKMLAEARV